MNASSLISPDIPGGDPTEIRRRFHLETVYKLASNENPLGPSPSALEAIVAALPDLNLYPNTKLPFEPSSLAQAAGIAALADQDFLLRSLAYNASAICFLTDSLRELGFEYVSSHANFVQVVLSCEDEALALTDELLRQGVIIRHLAGFGLPHCVRISAGTPEANQRCVEGIAHFTRSFSP